MKIMECKQIHIDKIAKLSDLIIEDLAQKGKADFFGGVDCEEIKEAMVFPSKTFILVNNNEIIGFILLKIPDKKEIEDYKSFFNVDKSLVINGYGINPEYRNKNLSFKLLSIAKEYALKNGFDSLIGTVHPENTASKKAMQKIAKDFILKDKIIYTMKDGRKLIRERFLLTL